MIDFFRKQRAPGHAHPQGEDELMRAVEQAYSKAAGDPAAKHAFPVGRAFAESIGYPAEVLDRLPTASVDAFAGVSNVSVFAEIPAGSAVLDAGCGAGLDALIAADKAGPQGSVTGVDFSGPMLDRARSAAAAAGVQTVRFLSGDVCALPLPDASIDVALVNGIFNLNPKRAEIFRELARVVKPGGVLYGAELILARPGGATRTGTASDWFA